MGVGSSQRGAGYAGGEEQAGECCGGVGGGIQRGCCYGIFQGEIVVVAMEYFKVKL